MKKIIMTTMLCLFAWTNIALSAENVIHYSNRPGNMLVKYNDVILATIGNGKVNITEAGELMLETNLNTEGKIYLNDKRTGNNILNVTSRFFKKYNATLHILNDVSGMTLVSVTLSGKPGFVHGINVVEFLTTVEKNLEDNLTNAQEALEQALRDGADSAVAEAAVEAAVNNFSDFENFLRGLGLDEVNSGISGVVSEEYSNVIGYGYFSSDEQGYVTQSDGYFVSEDGTELIAHASDGNANVVDASK